MTNASDKYSWIDRAAYPFPSHYLEVTGGRMHYVDEGPEQQHTETSGASEPAGGASESAGGKIESDGGPAGGPILMLHGNPTWSFLYRDLIKRLRKTRRCVAPDHIGFGLSDKPFEWSYHPEEHARNIEQLITELDLTDITLVLHDWGGPIGLRCAISRPDKISRIILMNTWAWPVTGDPYYYVFSKFMGGGIGRLLIERFNVFVRVVMPMVFGKSSKLTPEIRRHYVQPLTARTDRKGCWMFARSIVGASRWLDDIWSSREVLDGVPMLIAWGMEDIGFRKKEYRRWREAFPRATCAPLKDIGHFVPEEAPDALGAAVEEFL